MAKFQVPSEEKLWIQPNKGDSFGNLYSTWNMDFDTVLGKARLAARPVIITDSTDDTDLGIPTAFVRYTEGTDRWWALCGTRLFRTVGTNPASSFTEAVSDDGGSTSPPTTMTAVSSDMVVFNKKLYVSDSTGINQLDATVWDNNWWITTLGKTALQSGIPHPLYVSKKTNLLLIGDGEFIHTVDKNNNVGYKRLIFGPEYQCVWIRSANDGSWFGLRHKFNGEAIAVFWDEKAENYNRPYGLKSNYTYACAIKGEIPYVVNDAGQLLYFTGFSFSEAAVFPVYRQTGKRWQNSFTISRSVHRNGMAVINGEVHILLTSKINGGILSDVIENFPSGIWTFNEKQGLRHKYSLSQYKGTEIDYGAFEPPDAGALALTDPDKGLFLAGGTVNTNVSSELSAIYYLDITDTPPRRGYFITSVFEASAFEDIFKDILLSFKRFKYANDRIVIKYRSVKNDNLPIFGSGTWSSATVFTTSQSLTNAAVGDEVEIIRGRGAGAAAHIQNLSENAGIWTVTLDEAITNVSGTMAFMVRNFKKAAVISTQNIERQGFDLDVPGTFLQLKIELRSKGTGQTGYSPELEKVVINSTLEIVE